MLIAFLGRYINAYAPVPGAGTVWTLYLGQNISGGPWAAVLTGMGQPNSAGVSPASFSVYYNNNLTNTTSAYPGNTVIFTVGNASLRLSVVQTTTIQPAPIIANAATTSYIYTSTAPQISIPANITISSNTISTGVGLAKEILGFISSLLSWIQAHIHISGFAT